MAYIVDIPKALNFNQHPDLNLSVSTLKILFLNQYQPIINQYVAKNLIWKRKFGRLRKQCHPDIIYILFKNFLECD